MYCTARSMRTSAGRLSLKAKVLNLKLPTTFVPERFLLDLADEHKGVFSPRYRHNAAAGICFIS